MELANDEDPTAALKKAKSGPTGLLAPVACCCGPLALVPLIAWIIGGAVLTAIVFGASLGAPAAVSCFPKDESYYVHVVGLPQVAQVEPPMVCNWYDAQLVTVSGSGFLRYNDLLPIVKITNPTNNVNVTPISLHGFGARGCVEQQVRGQDVFLCESFQVLIPVDVNQTDEVWFPELHTVNPKPSLRNIPISPGECANDTSALLVLVPPPLLADVFPPAICQGLVQPLTISGAHFLQQALNESLVEPLVELNPGSAGQYEVLAADQTSSDCSPFPVDGFASTEECQTMVVVVDAAANQTQLGLNQLQMTNPAPANCVNQAPASFLVVQPPVVSEVVPPVVCGSIALDLDLVGDFFLEVDGEPSVVLLDLVAESNQTVLSTLQLLVKSVDQCVPLPLQGHTVRQCQRMTVTVPQRSVAVAVFAELRVQPPFLDACTQPFAGRINVTTRQLNVFYVEPPVTFNQINLQLTIFLSGADDGVDTVIFRHTNASVPDHVFTLQQGQLTFLGGSVNRPQVIIPAGAIAGDYEVTVVSSFGCVAQVAGLFTVLAQQSVSVGAVDPKFIFTGENTGISIVCQLAGGVCDSSAQANQPFVSTPTVYLNPQGVTGVALALPGTVFKNQGLLTSAVPANTPPGTYQIVVINPEPFNTVGVLSGALEVLPFRPPVVDTVNPGTLIGSSITLTVHGSGFATTNMSINLTNCVLPGIKDNALMTEQTSFFDTVVFGPGSTSTIVATVTFGTAAGPMQEMEACQLSVLNPASLASASTKFTALVAGRVNSKANPWINGVRELNHKLRTAKRGLALVTARVTEASRYMYAIGGDEAPNTLITNATDKVEFATFTSSGAVLGLADGRWDVQPARLPRKLAFPGAATVDRFVYVSGGTDGATVSNRLFRAQVLSPFESPAVDLDLDVVPNDALNNPLNITSFPPGLYSYRVSAKFGPNDDNNPNGESLPGDPLSIAVPDIPDALVVLTLKWPKVPNAVGYLLYRTPRADADFSLLSLRAEVVGGDTLNFTDFGFANNDTSKVPLFEGHLGNWRDMSTGSSPVSLTTGRWAHGMDFAVNPANPTQFFLYVAKGLSLVNPLTISTTNYLSTYEVFRIQTAAADPAVPLSSPTQTVTKIGTTHEYPEDGASPNRRAFVSMRRMCPPDIATANGWNQPSQCVMYTSAGSEFVSNTQIRANQRHNTNPVLSTGLLGLGAVESRGRAEHGSCTIAANNFLTVYNGNPDPAANANTIPLNFVIPENSGDLYHRLAVGTGVAFNQAVFTLGSAVSQDTPAPANLHSDHASAYGGCVFENSYMYYVGGQSRLPASTTQTVLDTVRNAPP